MPKSARNYLKSKTMNTKSLALFLILISLNILHSKRYDNYTLYNVFPTERYQLKFLQNLETQKYIDVMFWKRPFKLYNDVQLIVNPTDLELFQERVLHFKLDATILLPDVQKAFDQQVMNRVSYMRLQVDKFSWNHYHNLKDIYQWLADVAIKYSNVSELISIGKSAEGRDIYAISIKKGKPKAKVIIEGAIHGNEWISAAFVTFLVKELLHSERSQNKKFREIALKYQWFLIPIVNPDGYEYSVEVDHLWRKNRRPLGSSYGVDLNRNFAHEFGTYGASKEPLDPYYCGPKPFSEPESAALADFIEKEKDKLNFYFSFHAYGQKIIIPFSDRVKHVDNFAEMENYGKQAILKMYKLNGVKYNIGTIYDTLGFRISGNSASWVKKNFKVKYVMTFILRDNGTYGFALPPEQILPTCKETLVGLTEIMTARHRRMATVLFSSGQRLHRNMWNILFLLLIKLIVFL